MKDTALFPVFLCNVDGKQPKLTNEEFIELSEKVSKSKAKWDKLRAKYPGKTTREILAIERCP